VGTDDGTNRKVNLNRSHNQRKERGKIIKRRVLISISYVAEVEHTDFWKKGGLADGVKEGLESHFPKRIELTSAIKAGREHLSYLPIDLPHTNVSQCPLCKHFMAHAANPNPMLILRDAKDVEGVSICSLCAWEVEFDLKHGETMESIFKSCEESEFDQTEEEE